MILKALPTAHRTTLIASARAKRESQNATKTVASYSLSNKQNKQDLPGYAHFLKATNLVLRGYILDAAVELFTPFIGILPRSLLAFVDFHHSNNRWKHHLNNIQIWPAHAIDFRIPQSSLLITSISYEGGDAQDDEIDRWLLRWLQEHEFEPEPQLQDRYKTALLYDLAISTERSEFVQRIIEGRDEKAQELRDVYVDQEEWMGSILSRIGMR